MIILGFIFLYGSLLWIGETGGIFYSQLSQLVLISYPLYWIIRFVVWSIRVLGGLHYFENLIKDFEKKNVFFIKKVLHSLLIIWLLLLPLYGLIEIIANWEDYSNKLVNRWNQFVNYFEVKKVKQSIGRFTVEELPTSIEKKVKFKITTVDGKFVIVERKEHIPPTNQEAKELFSRIYPNLEFEDFFIEELEPVPPKKSGFIPDAE